MELLHAIVLGALWFINLSLGAILFAFWLPFS